jgi:hypothetical protein
MKRRHLDDLDRDIRDHIEKETQDNIARGMAPDEARRAAVRKFGNILRVQEDTRDVWSVVWIEQLLQDLRYGLRVRRRNGMKAAPLAFAQIYFECAGDLKDVLLIWRFEPPLFESLQDMVFENAACRDRLGLRHKSGGVDGETGFPAFARCDRATAGAGRPA